MLRVLQVFSTACAFRNTPTVTLTSVGRQNHSHTHWFMAIARRLIRQSRHCQDTMKKFERPRGGGGGGGLRCRDIAARKRWKIFDVMRQAARQAVFYTASNNLFRPHTYYLISTMFIARFNTREVCLYFFSEILQWKHYARKIPDDAIWYNLSNTHHSPNC